MRFLLQRYLASQFIRPFLMGTIFFVIFLLTFQLFRVTDLIVSKGLGYGFVATLVWEIALSLFPLALPLSIFFSTLYSLGKASEESELVVMRSIGMTKFQILLPYLIVAITAGVSLFFISDILAPRAKLSFKEKVQYLKTQGTLTDIKSGEFFTLIPRVTLFAKEVDSENNKMQGIFLNFDEKNGGYKAIMAESGDLIKKTDKAGNIRMDLILKNGNILQVNKDTNEKILFEEYAFPIPLGNAIAFNPKPQNMEGSDLKEFLNMGVEGFKKNKRSAKEYYRVQTEYHNRRNMPVVVVVLTLIAFSLGFKTQRRRNRNGQKAFLILIGYYVLYFSLLSVGSKGVVPIPLLVYTPVVLLFGVFIYYYRKMDWAS